MLPSTYVNVQKPWLVNQPQSITSFLCFTDGIHDFLKASSHFLQTYNLLSLPITICPHWFCSTPCYSFMSAWNFFFLTDKTTFLSLLEIQLHCFVLVFFSNLFHVIVVEIFRYIGKWTFPVSFRNSLVIKLFICHNHSDISSYRFLFRN